MLLIIIYKYRNETINIAPSDTLVRTMPTSGETQKSEKEYWINSLQVKKYLR